jgi:pilus assembly protein Flp/PilA
MTNLLAVLQSFTARRDEKGATATEYALLVALIAIVIVVAVTIFGTNLNDFFQYIADEVDGWTA